MRTEAILAVSSFLSSEFLFALCKEVYLDEHQVVRVHDSYPRSAIMLLCDCRFCEERGDSVKKAFKSK